MSAVDPQTTTELIKSVLELLAQAKTLFGAASARVRRARLERYATPRALQRAVLRREVDVGQTVKVEGYLSRYAHLYRPISFLNFHLDAESMASTVSRMRSLGQKVLMLADVRASQNPIAALPPLVVDGERVRCLFLYPSSHDRFIYQKAVDRSDTLKSMRLPDWRTPRIAIPESGRPIPVLVPVDESHRLAEKKVVLTCVVRELPQGLADRFGALYARHYDRSVLQNFLLLPHDPPVSFCLSMLTLEADVGGDVTKSVRAADRSLLYVEGHIELSEDLPDLPSIFSDAVPLEPRIGHLSQQSFGPRSVNIIGTSAPADPEETARLAAAPGDISVIFRRPNIVGFYAETGPTRPLTDRTVELASMVSSFSHNLARACEERGVRAALEADFVFDFERQHLFFPQGVLSSEEALAAIRGDKGLEATTSWLRDDSNLFG